MKPQMNTDEHRSVFIRVHRWFPLILSGALVLCLCDKTEAGGSKALSWGGDAEGGAPFQFQDPREPSRIIGFEVDIADAIGRVLGRPVQFVQNQWDGLIPGL